MKTTTKKRHLSLWCFLIFTLFSVSAKVLATDLANAPLATSTTTNVQPNLVFVIDDSGSMAWTHMPDAKQDNSAVSWTYGYYGLRSSQCNGLYYNPSFTYTPPIKADGTYYPNASFTGAYTNGYSTAGKTPVNLSTSYKFIDEGSSGISSAADSTGAPAYYYIYTGSQTSKESQDYNSTTSTFFSECNSALDTSPGSEVFTKVVVSASSGPGGTDEQTNFANWYSYYRTRTLAMKTAAGLAFKGMDNHYRIGFMAINNKAAFLAPAAFEGTQKTNWYAKLYAINPSGSTPLRTALADLGKLYAHKPQSNGSTLADPVQYSCQQNFGILSSDGYWNTGDGTNLSGQLVGNQDGAVPRPYFDGSTVIIKKSTNQMTMTQTQLTKSTSQIQKRTQQIQSSSSTLQKRTYNTSTKKWSSWANVTSGNCTAVAGLTECQYTAWTTYANATSCTQTDQSSGPVYTVLKAYQCQNVDTTSPIWTYASSCTPGTSSGKIISCNPITTGPDIVNSCTKTTPSSGNNYLTTSCVTNTLASSVPVESCTAASADDTNGHITTTCASKATGPTVVDACTEQTASTANNWLTVTCSSTPTGGSSDTLADLAQYYYMTDLRTSDLGNCTGASGGDADVCENNVLPAGRDTAAWQHLTLFTMGLGARGRMLYSDDYLSEKDGDYASVANGVTANPPSVCSWQASGSGVCNWPIPGIGTGSGKIENLDDMWHSAVNGRGTFYAAKDPATLSSGLSSALAGIKAIPGAASAATTSTSTVTLEDNSLFLTEYTTGQWDGNLIRQLIDVKTGSIPTYNKDNSSTFKWSAQSLLDTKELATRKVYYAKSGTLAEFKWDQLSGTEQGYFSKSSISGLSQFCGAGTTCLSDEDQTKAAGAKLVAYLTGDRSNEGTETENAKYYRKRIHVLGDLVNSEPNFVPAPNQAYTDSGYATFKNDHKNRQAIVYVGGNDGMLHAFDASTGSEIWAFIPSMVLPDLYKLADKNYAKLHKYFVDGSPVVGDVCINNCTSDTDADWRTILVGGLGGGGRGYFALDVTNPDSPSLLWEFTNTNLGYTYGNPVITKIKPSNTWVVMVASGYNNISPGDGVGRLFVLNAGTGALVSTLSTGVGSGSNPSGLTKISAWGSGSADNNTTSRVYAGDTLGNLWRFNVEDTMGVQLLATLKNPSGGAQPITAKAELGKVNGEPVVFVGTGKYLGVSDELDTGVQSVYALKDPLTNPGTVIYDNPRSNTCSTGLTKDCFVKQSITTIDCPDSADDTICLPDEIIRQTVATSVDIKQKDGWYFDLPDTGERVNTDLSLALGTLLVNSNIPGADACNTGGDSFRYFLDYRNGGAVGVAITSTSTSTSGGGGGSSGTGTDGSGGGGVGTGETTTTITGITGQKVADAIASAPTLYQIPSGTIFEGIRLSNATYKNFVVPYNAAGGTVAKRVSWREVIIDR